MVKEEPTNTGQFPTNTASAATKKCGLPFVVGERGFVARHRSPVDCVDVSFCFDRCLRTNADHLQPVHFGVYAGWYLFGKAAAGLVEGHKEYNAIFDYLLTMDNLLYYMLLFLLWLLLW